MEICGEAMPVATSSDPHLFLILHPTTATARLISAFTYMFGGFSSAFYDAYENVYPLDPGFDQRKFVYNLYHELNHFNLFGVRAMHPLPSRV